MCRPKKPSEMTEGNKTLPSEAREPQAALPACSGPGPRAPPVWQTAPRS